MYLYNIYILTVNQLQRSYSVAVPGNEMPSQRIDITHSIYRWRGNSTTVYDVRISLLVTVAAGRQLLITKTFFTENKSPTP
jgi:hypothetical protein